MSPSRLKRETCPTQEWCHKALLISSQINSQLFRVNKGRRGGNQPPEGQMVSVQSPLTPAALSSLAGLRVLGARRPPSVSSTLVHSNNTVLAV
ncbi:hypothetical protein CgunFtcFv8_023563 [Champsocephalus gunnari]|uniref:Uncharacterized protein n=1 Tax=Champsocephalus gunnari TaxID=52237 RepID=A0AAN8DA41_CHAGU|nr:hypothetical protein CgunFtcFv8_023563 [Champsocephalus gunnari]